MRAGDEIPVSMQNCAYDFEAQSAFIMAEGDGAKTHCRYVDLGVRAF